MSRTDVFGDVIVERANQDAKWGEQNHSWGDWMLILGEEFGEVCQEMLNHRFAQDDADADAAIRKLREELIQLAAVNIAIIEYLERTYHE